MTAPLRVVRSFARIEGRLSASQEAAYSEFGHLVVTPTSGLLTEIDPAFRLESVFDGGAAPLVLEVGSGNGAQAIAYAAAHPEANVLAVEVYREGIADGLRAGAHLPNLRFVRADAAALFASAAPEGGLAEVWTYFPDPWRKARHAKRRIVNDSFAVNVARALAPGGVWRLATDWPDYTDHMAEVLSRSSLRVVPADRAERIVTKYEAKAIAAGREIHEFCAVKDA